jgi:mono/diheme cytochrome c family protein
MIGVSAATVASCSVVKQYSPASRSEDYKSANAEAGPVFPGVKPGTESGDLLYGQYCAGCHGQLSDTTKRGASQENIANALSTVPAMASLKPLFNNEQIARIAVSLSNTNRPPQDPSVTPDGKALYATNCASCHESLINSNRKGMSAASIERGIQVVPVMKRLSFLTQAELIAISNELKNPANSIPEFTVKLPRLLDRNQLAARLKRIYSAGQAPAAVLAVTNVLDAEILKQPQVFGGNCARTESNCNNLIFNFNFSEAETMPIAGVIRAGRLHRACTTIASQDSAMRAFATAVSGNLAVAPSMVQIDGAISKLNLGFVPSTASVSALRALITQAKAPSGAFFRLRSVPHWQWRPYRYETVRPKSRP